MTTGQVYCNVIAACQELGDLRRAGEWTEALRSWCESQPASVFPGLCRVHRAEVMHFRGSWADAESEARQACTDLLDTMPSFAGEAFYQVGEVRRRLGDMAEAETAFRRAGELGREPQPGLALVRLCAGKHDAAAAAVRRKLARGAQPPDAGAAAGGAGRDRDRIRRSSDRRCRWRASSGRSPMSTGAMRCWRRRRRGGRRRVELRRRDRRSALAATRDGSCGSLRTVRSRRRRRAGRWDSRAARSGTKRARSSRSAGRSGCSSGSAPRSKQRAPPSCSPGIRRRRGSHRVSSRCSVWSLPARAIARSRTRCT